MISIVTGIIMLIIFFLFSSCGLFFGDPSDITKYHINNQSDYNLRCELAYNDFLESLYFDTVYVDSKLSIKILHIYDRTTPSETLDTVRLYLSTNDSSDNKLLYEQIVYYDDEWVLAGHKSDRWGTIDDWELKIENSDLDFK